MNKASELRAPEPDVTLEGRSDVLIVGAGPSGCAAGITLRRAGYDVCVVDAAQFPRDKVCGDALSDLAVRAVDALGAGGEMRRGPYARVRRAAAVFPHGARIEREYDEPGAIVPRRHLDLCLRRALEDSGARVFEGQRVSALTQNGHGFSGATGPKLRWSSPVVITTDGYGSVGLKALGIAPPRGRHLAVSATRYYRKVAFPNGADTSDHYFEHDLPFGYAWVFPEAEGLSNVGVYIRADAYAARRSKLPQLLADFIARHPERFAQAEPAGDIRSWSLPLAPRGARTAADGLLLAGDSASFVDPLSGEGIWQALHSGRLAGITAVRALRKGRLDAELQRTYVRACAQSIGRPSRHKAWVQQVIEVIMRGRMYGNPAVLAALGWGYEHKLLQSEAP
jgi:geranylgeranyl reductase family protein